MADTGLTPAVRDVTDIDGLAETLLWAQTIRRNPNHTTTAYLLADELIAQTQALLAFAREQIDHCNVEPLPQAHRVSS